MAVSSITATAITFTVTAVSTRTNTLTWQGIQVRPTVSAPQASGNITHTGTSSITGVTTSTNFGTLTEVASTPVCNPSTTIADGTNPANSTIGPGAAITDLDAFTLKTDAGTDAVTAVTVTLGPTGAFNNIAKVDITDNSNLARCTAVTNPASNTISFNTCSSNGGIPVTTAVTTYKVRITPKTHAAMPTPPGASYATTGTVTSFASTNPQAGTDTTSATITVDNASPASATAVSGSSDNAKVTLNWTSSNSTDFSTTSGSVVYRWAAGTAGSEVPVEGSTPAKGDTNGTATAACVVSSAASTALVRIDGSGGSADCTTTALTNGQAYTYKVFQKDSYGNYDVGVVAGTITPAVVNCTSQATGNWTASSTWTNCRGGIPLAGDGVTVASSHNVTLNVNTPSLTTLTINSGGTLTNTGSYTITLTGDMSNAGTYSGGSGSITLGGNFTNTGSYSAGSATTTLSGNFSNSGTFTADTGTWVFSGSSAQSITGVTVFYKMTVNNTSGISLNNSVSTSSLLTLTGGSITTGANIISTISACPGSIARTSGFVSGNLQLTFPSGTTTCTFYVGSGTTYAPIGMTLTTTLLGGGTLTGSTTGNEHPQVVGSGIDSTLDVNRYWSLWSSGDTVNAGNYSPTFNFVAGDVDALATPANFVVGKYTGSVWSLITPPGGSALATSTAVSIAAGIAAPTDFISGQASFVCAVPVGSPTGTTCVCDNFSRTNLNPSTIYNGNWNVSSSGIHSFLPQITNNRLRLTDGNGSESTAATGPGIFPAAGNWVTAEFRHYAYGGTGGDGMALTLSDSTVTAVPGAFGGSLGYAQKSNPGSDCTTTGGCPGFAGGWIGIALDEYGNFSANTEGRTGGAAPGLVAESVAVRGSGSGLTGYPYLGGTDTLNPGIDNPSPATDGFGYAYRLTVDARCYQLNTTSADIVCNNPSLAKTTMVTVERDTTGTGNNYSTLLGPFDAYVVNPSQANVPANWQLSYTGSTGGSTNIHEIAGMKVCAQTYTPPAGYRILVDNFSPTTCATDPRPTVTVSALDTNGNIVANYTNLVTLSAKLSGGANSSATWSKISGGGVLSASTGGSATYQFVAGDNSVAQFSLSDTVSETVYITVSDTAGTLNSSLGTPVQFFGGAASFIVDIPDVLAQQPASSASPDPLGGGVVAGRAHLLRVTRNQATCGGGTDTTFAGSKPLDAWYNPAVSDHPAGAGAPQICAPVSGLCQPSYGICETLSIAAPALSSSSNNLNLTFAGGVADFCLVTTDVGKYTLGLRDDTTTPASPVYGSSVTLTARPFAAVVSGLYQGATANPNGNTLSPGDTVFAKAGSSFQAAVGGYLWDSAGDMNGDGLPDSGATLTQLTGSGTAPHYGDTVTLSATAPFAPATSSDTPPGTGTKGLLANGSVTFTGGGATLSTLSYPEVGSFTLKAAASTNYLNSGIDLGARVAIFSQPANTFQNARVGRFIPDHFLLTAPTPSPACGTFTYFGQDGFKTVFTLTAQNANGTQTNNYAGDGSSNSWAKLPLTAWGAAPASAGSPGYGFAAGAWSPALPAGAALAASATLPTATNANAWLSGSATVTAQHQVSRPTSPAAPTTVNVTALPVDSDGVTMTTAATLDTATPLRYGRLALQNANGSELLDLPMSFTAENWNGASWVTNTDDQCTTGITLSETAVTGPISTLCAYDTGTPGSSGLGCSVPGSSTNKFSQPPAAGEFNLNFQAPGAGNTGVMDITATVPAYLTFNWKGAGNTNPTASATLGVYKGNSKFIYIRELY
ncbi:MAG: hypothetical protein M0Q44_10990 [Methylobacter sp.]|nr:hypothetical protein [Methylobacter sp.]